MSKIKTIGILTSGGDAPGMNAAIRAVTRAGIYNGFNIKGIYRGYDGLIKGEVKQFTTENVSGIITRGGTILKTARSKEFMTREGRQKAYETCQKEEIDALVVIGVMSDLKYSEQEIDLVPEMTLFLYTDGLTEAENAERELFGKQRIDNVITTFSGTPQQLVETMTAAVHQFVGDTEQSDDITMLAFRIRK